MNKLVIIVLILTIGLLSGCVYEPLEVDLNTRNIYPIANNIYDIGSSALNYNEIFVSNLTLGGITFTSANISGGVGVEVDPIWSASPSFGITAPEIINWNTAFGWGNHALAGYLTLELDPVFTVSFANSIGTANVTNWNTAFGWGNHALAGYLTSELDPVFLASVAYSIQSANITAWNTQSGVASNGWLSSIDWNTFNGKISSQWITDANGINYSSGNVSIGGGTAGAGKELLLSSSNATAGSSLKDSPILTLRATYWY